MDRIKKLVMLYTKHLNTIKEYSNQITKERYRAK